MQLVSVFHAGMSAADRASRDAGAWFVEADHASTAALARRRSRAPMDEERAKSGRVVIAVEWGRPRPAGYPKFSAETIDGGYFARYFRSSFSRDRDRTDADHAFRLPAGVAGLRVAHLQPSPSRRSGPRRLDPCQC